MRGATGITHDWSVSSRIVEMVRKPVWLAGGLSLANVQQAIDRVRPYGIDVETGVQAPDGSKDFDHIAHLVQFAHGVTLDHPTHQGKVNGMRAESTSSSPSREVHNSQR